MIALDLMFETPVQRLMTLGRISCQG